MALITGWVCVNIDSQGGKKHQQLCSERMFFYLQWFLSFNEPDAFTQSLPFFTVEVADVSVTAAHGHTK